MRSVSDNKGITLIALIVTIIVLLIIAGISISGGIQGIDNANDSRAMGDLEKVQHAISERYTKYNLMKDKTLLVGTKLDTLPTLPTKEGETETKWKVFQVNSGETVSTHPERKYYRLSKADLNDLGLTGDFQGASYVVNYYSGEVYDENQQQTSKGDILYKTAIENEASELGDEVIQDGLQVWYDAINNTGSGHSNSTTTWKDLSGNGRDGKTTDVTWNSNYADFNGTSSWVNMLEINDYTNKTTFEATIEVPQIQSGEHEIMDNFDGGGLGLRLVDGKPVFMLFLQGLGYVDCEWNETIVVNKKICIVGVYNENNLDLYINGVKQNNITIKKHSDNETIVLDTVRNISKPLNNTVMAIGANPTGKLLNPALRYAGKIFSAKIYNKALLADEIKHNYILDKNRYGIEE